MIPTFGASLAVPGAVLGCGGLVPYVVSPAPPAHRNVFPSRQVAVQGDISGLRLHFQSTTDDLAALQTSMYAVASFSSAWANNALSPQAITAYEKLITDTTLLTADASPTGGHWYVSTFHSPQGAA